MHLVIYTGERFIWNVFSPMPCWVVLGVPVVRWFRDFSFPAVDIFMIWIVWLDWVLTLRSLSHIYEFSRGAREKRHQTLFCTSMLLKSLVTVRVVVLYSLDQTPAEFGHRVKHSLSSSSPVCSKPERRGSDVSTLSTSSEKVQTCLPVESSLILWWKQLEWLQTTEALVVGKLFQLITLF